MAVLDGDGNRVPTPPSEQKQGLFNEYSEEDEGAIDYLNQKASESDTNTYDMNEDQIASVANKYKAMLDVRLKYGEDDIDITDCVPKLEEMFSDDLAYDFYKELAGSEEEQDILDAAFYTDIPDLTLGYRPDDHTFVLEYSQGSLDHLDKLAALNMIDGDTTQFKLSGVSAIPEFTIGDVTYSNFEDYCKKLNIIGLNGESDPGFSLRSVGIDAPEIPHYELAAVKKEDIVEMSLYEAKNKGALYQKYTISGDTVTERDNNTVAKFYKSGSTYVELIGEENEVLKELGSTSDMNTTDYVYYKIPAEDQSNSGTVVDGLKAKDLYYETLKNANKIYLKLDANGVMASKTSSSGKLYYNYWWNADDVISTMVDQWQNAMTDNAPLTRLSFSPFGLDAYGRFLGEVYAEINLNGQPTLVNVNKYVLAQSQYVEGNPTFTNSVEQNNVYGNVASSFELWTYDKDNRIYLDSLSEQSKNSYNGRIELHKEITGIDFLAFRSCTMMLGDTLFLIPPTNIRNMSNVEYEKIGTLRGKGSMVKSLTAREQYLEIDLYFYEEYGINGLPYTCTLPNGKEITYYMDGLLSLLAQFKVAPYLPIENQYINDVLGIEAVSLVSINYSTLEEYPRLLKATLVLRDFNYHIYMPDVPLDVKDDTTINEFSEMNPIFAKCFHWEAFRYYYQRQIVNGLRLSQCEYNTTEYNETFYKSKNAIKPVNFCEYSDCFSLYVPDEDWLKNALALKKNKDYYGQMPVEIELSDEAKNFISNLGNIRQYLKVPSSLSQPIIQDCTINSSLTIGMGNRKELKNIFTKGSFLTSNKGNAITYEENMINPIIEGATSTSALIYIDTDSEVNKTDDTIKWKINFEVDTSTLSSQDLLEIKEVLKDLLGNQNINNILTDNELSIIITAKLDEDHNKIVDFISTESENQIIELLHVQNGTSDENGTALNDLNNMMHDRYDYMNPAAMEFVPYIENVRAQGLAVSMSNSFTELSLKIMDGSAPQYMGAGDIVIEIRVITDDLTTISMLNVLPTHSMNIAKAYRRILNCWPLRIRNHYVNMAGVNEVLIDSIGIENVEGFPGLYTITMRFTSVDRTMRSREQLKEIDSKKITTQSNTAAIGTYFDIEESLANVELYPDLDLPTLEELKQVGYYFVKYANKTMVYPDPDFYMVYAYEYTAKIIKKSIKEVFLEQGLLLTNEKSEEEQNQYSTTMTVKDHMNQKLEMNFCSTGSEIVNDSLNDQALWYNNALQELMNLPESEISKTIKGVTDDRTPKDEKALEAYNDLMMVTICDPLYGWEVRQGWYAPMCPTSLNDAVRDCERSNQSTSKVPEDLKTNESSIFIFDRRKELIELIDSLLSKPIDYSSFNEEGYEGGDTLACGNITSITKRAVDKIFKEDEDGAKILEIMCPFCETDNIDTIEWTEPSGKKKYFDGDNVLNFIQMFLHASGCALTGREIKTENKDYSDYGPRHWYIKDNKRTDIPICHCKSAKGTPQATSYEQAIENGIDFGMFCIMKQTKDEILARIKPISSYKEIDYLGGPDSKVNKTLEMYSKYKDGFIDPYYNALKEGDSELKKYMEKIAESPMCNAIAYLRVVLVYLRKQLIDGYLISDLDTAANDWDETRTAFSEGTLANKENIMTTLSWAIKEAPTGVWNMIVQVYKAAERDENSDAGFWESVYYTLGGNEVVPETDSKLLNGLMKVPLVGYLVEGVYNYYDDSTDELESELIQNNLGLDEEQAKAFQEQLDTMSTTYAKAFCMRLIYPFAEAATQTLKGKDTNVESYFLNRNYDQLNVLVNSLSSDGTKTSQPFTKFLLSMTGFIVQMPNESTPGTTSDAQKALNLILREAFTKLSEDPRYYVLHSFYDMLVNDKRGRLLRAFPTYYIVFIDEGRRIGSWKLFDNFYNMSAISEITITKSRKIPADTCSFVMSNMFGSYAAEYDTTTRQQYVDVYTYRDTFTSIFSPLEYVKKEDALRRREDNLETTVLKPGVRIHIRMGYGANASTLPTVFNGKIAEIDVGDVVTVVGQGDGIELMNPLNALGDIETTSLIESQQFCTLFKDLRGSLARGGLSPRNLLVQLLTAEHGGVIKAALRTITNNRIYADNPFGIYHFGDKRFCDIFVEGEGVQNLYEVVDGSLLEGVNTLCPTEDNSYITPTINTTIQDKTFWDILTMCAYSGIGYIGAVRDFGFRSTVCLCRRNQYYAYAYKKTDGKYAEKRKPFQQFHYLDSYTDIIYNSIKASEKNIKTNATGIWEGTDLIWGSESKTVGPIYLDINIYPEYQKSMTVDTGLVATGNGGIDIPFMNWFSEEWNLSADADKVNKSLAERITTNTLRETIMNMYTGEVCVIGNTAIKPYDRISITDTYEDMSGQVEVEAVVHSMNFNTGFTTTVYPDLIVRQEDQHEASVQRIDGAVSSGLIMAVTVPCGLNAIFWRESSKLMTAYANMAKVSETDIKAIEQFAGSSLGRLLNIDKLDKDTIINIASMTKQGLVHLWARTCVVQANALVFTKTAKSWITRWLRNIQALDVYPIVKNDRPLVAGMSGHRGSVIGYEYSDEEKDDSVQGMIRAVYNKIDNSFFGLGEYLLSPILDLNEFNVIMNDWERSLFSTEDKENNNCLQQESIYQNAYTAASMEKRSKNASIPMLKYKYRLKRFDTKNGTSKTYLKYRNLGITTNKNLTIPLEPIGDTGILPSTIYSNPNVLGLYPIEDDPEIKKAITGANASEVSLYIAHSVAPLNATIPFECGARVIKFSAEDNPNSTFANYPILDMPMLQEDALYVLKFLLNHEYLKKKKLTFLSGTRLNDTKTWKNTGFQFTLQCDDEEALKNAVAHLKSDVCWTIDNKLCPMFNYQVTEGKCVITIYAEAEPDDYDTGEEGEDS